MAEHFLLVREGQNLLHQIDAESFAELRSEVQRWREILAVQYNQFKSKDIPS
jgi:hypothetical protein